MRGRDFLLEEVAVVVVILVVLFVVVVVVFGVVLPSESTELYYSGPVSIAQA